MEHLNPDGIYTVDQCQQYLNCSRVTVYRLLEQGRLKSFKVGHLRRIRGEAIAQFIQATEQQPYEATL